MNPSKRKKLGDAVILRIILIILLVMYHAFAPYSGAWDSISEVEDNWLYCWLDNYIRVFLVEGFVFLSGYVLGYNVRVRGEDQINSKQFLLGKFKHLMIPCILFSFLYITIFSDISQPALKTIYDIMNGAGHMWFLPMLMCCFVAVWKIERLKPKTTYIFVILILSLLLSISSIPFGIGEAMYYLLFFYTGYYIQRRGRNLSIHKPLSAFLIVIAYLILTPVLFKLREGVGTMVEIGNPYFERMTEAIILHLIRGINAGLGLLSLLSIVSAIVKNRTISTKLYDISMLSMGIYLVHQFVLKYIYYKTTLPLAEVKWMLPWLTTIFTLLFSYTIVRMIRKTVVGRLMFGMPLNK